MNNTASLLNRYGLLCYFALWLIWPPYCCIRLLYIEECSFYYGIAVFSNMLQFLFIVSSNVSGQASFLETFQNSGSTTATLNVDNTIFGCTVT